MIYSYYIIGVFMKKVVKKRCDINKLFFIFFLGCLAGYIYEVIYYLVDDGIFVNRGFLYGPYLPVYGVGALLIYLLLNRFRKKPVIVFLLSMFVTGVVEYLTGFWMWHVYKRMWWDYTGLFLNINGYVCFRSVFTFAIGSLILICIFVPLIDKFIKKFGKKESSILSITIFVIMLTDLILTLLYRY